MKTEPTLPKLSSTSFYPRDEPSFKQSFSTTGSTFGIALIVFMLLFLSWRYQYVTYKKLYKIEETYNTWEARNKLLDLQRQQEANLRDMQNYYYYNNLHPQQKLHQILKQNNPQELASFVDESILERMARPKHII